jgi:hypothetical protein
MNILILLKSVLSIIAILNEISVEVSIPFSNFLKIQSHGIPWNRKKCPPQKGNFKLKFDILLLSINPIKY